MAISEIGKNALTVLEKRYLAKDEEGNVVETVEEMFRRVADTIAAVDAKYDNTVNTKEVSDEFFELVAHDGSFAFWKWTPGNDIRGAGPYRRAPRRLRHAVNHEPS